MPNTHWQHTALALAAALFTGTAAQAAIQLQFDTLSGSSIAGVSTSPGYENSIDTNSFQWGVGVGISGGSGGTSRLVSHPSVSEIVWTQQQDKNYNQLTRGMLTGGRYNSTFSFLNGGANYLTVQTGNSAISGLSVSSGGGTPSVSGSEAFNRISIDYSPAALGLQGERARVGYASSTGTVSGDTSRPATFGAGTGSSGASGLYLRLGSGDTAIHGDSTDRSYENWIKIDSFQMGMGIGLSLQPDGSFLTSQPSISEVTLSQSFDGAVPAMLGNLLRGNVIGQATLELVTMGRSGPVTTMQLALDNVLLSGLSLSSGGDRPSVSESLNFTGFTQTLWDINADGTRGLADAFSYDTLNNRVRDAAAPVASIASFGAGQLAPMAAPVPEPQTWALMLSGIAMLGLLRRRLPA